MFWSNLKPLTVVPLMLGLVAYGGGLLEYQSTVAEQPNSQAQKETADPLKVVAKGEKASPDKGKGPKGKQSPTDEDKLRGRWKSLYAEQDGKPDKGVHIFTFEQRGWVLTETKGTFPMGRPYKIDSSTDPKTLDIAWSVKSKGTYVLDGDILVYRCEMEWPDRDNTTVRQTFLRVFKRE